MLIKIRYLNTDGHYFLLLDGYDSTRALIGY